MNIVVHKPFAVRLENGAVHYFQPGPADMPEEVFEHWYARACLRDGYFAPVFEAEPESGDDLNALTVRELEQLCNEAGIDIPKNARKADLVELLGAAE